MEKIIETVKKLTYRLYGERGQNMKDREVTMKQFLRIYNKALTEFFDAQDAGKDIENGIYGEDITIHWNGIYCNVGDGATAYNHIIQGIQGVIEETD